MKKILLFLFFAPLSIAAQNYATDFSCDFEAEKCVSSLVRLFPNPTTGVIEIVGLEDSDKEGAVFDAAGRLQLSKVVLTVPIDVSFLPQGIYFLRTKQKVFKFIKL
jgi:hypothetical protein